MWNLDTFITIVFNSKPDILHGNLDGLQTLSFLTWLTLCRAQINTFSWCFPDAQTLREQKKGTCVCSPVSLQLIAAREPLPTEHPAANKRSLPWMPAQVCSQVWSFSIYFPAACNVADVLLLLPCAGSSEKNRYEELGSWYVYFLCKSIQSVKIQVPVRLTHLPPDSLQLGQVHATLRSLLPSWPNWSSSSTSLTWRWDRSLVFRVESVLSCQSPESGSSFIRMSGMNVYININRS